MIAIELRWALPGRRMQLHAQRAEDFEHGGEFGVSVGSEGLVEAFAAEAGFAGDVGHALGPGDVAQRGGEYRGVAVSERRFQVGRDVGLGLEEVGRVPATSLGLGHLFGSL